VEFAAVEEAAGRRAEAYPLLVHRAGRWAGGWLRRLADLILYCCLDFAKGVGQPLDPALSNINAWFKRMEARPSAKGSLHPAWEQVGMRG